MIISDGGGNFTPAPEGIFQAVCVDVVDLGNVETQWGEKHKVRLAWQLNEIDEDNGKRYLVVGQYTASLNEKARLRAHLESWRGRKFTKEELKGFEMENLIGANCQIQVVHNTNGEKTYANVGAIVSLPKGMAKIAPLDYVRFKDREQQQPAANGNGGNGKKPAATADVPDNTPF